MEGCSGWLQIARPPARPLSPRPQFPSLSARARVPGRTCAGPAGATAGAGVRPRGRAGGGARRALAGRGCAGSASFPSWKPRSLRATFWRGRPQCTRFWRGKYRCPPSGGVGPGAPPFWKGRLGRVCAGAGSPCPGRRVACEPGQGPHCCGGRAQIPAPELEVGAGGQL